MANTKISTAEAIGDIRRFPLEYVWRPKLLMMKTETLETIIYDSLCAAYEHWLETDYGNKPDPGSFQQTREPHRHPYQSPTLPLG